jgi:hypothetical protein
MLRYVWSGYVESSYVKAVGLSQVESCHVRSSLAVSCQVKAVGVGWVRLS